MRMVFMAYITGTIEAVDFYYKAFNATSKNCFKYSDDDDFYGHAEIVLGDQTVLALSEASHYEKEFTNGTTISSESLKGKYVLLDFWAESCAPCIAEFPNLKELYAKTDREKFEIIGIVGRSSPNRLKERIEQHALAWPQIFSDNIVDMYGIPGFPTTFILDTEGTIIAKDVRGKELEEKILSLIKK